MLQHQEQIEVPTRGRGFHEINDQLRAVVKASGIVTGVAHVFIRHTSASLVIQENADPSAQYDMEQWLERVAPENDPKYTHTIEGSDDMPAHLRSLLTSTSETIPITKGQLGLGTWQGLYVCEHRARPNTRKVIVHIVGEPG